MSPWLKFFLVVLGIAGLLAVVVFIAAPVALIAPSYLGTPKKIDRAFFERTGDEKLEDALVKFVMNRKVGGRYEQEHEIVNGLPVGLKYTYAIWLFEMEYYNGGMPQFFLNLSGHFAREACEGYRYFGAGEMAAAVEEAMAIYESEKHLYLRYEETCAHEDFLALYENPAWEELEGRFLALTERHSARRVQFIRENMEDFFSQ